MYFGHFGQEKGGLPLPVSIQRAAKLPFSLGIFNAAGLFKSSFFLFLFLFLFKSSFVFGEGGADGLGAERNVTAI